MGAMSYITKYRWYLLGLIAVLLIAYAFYSHYEKTKPGPITTDVSTFVSGHVSFDYPRTYAVKEYSAGQVSVGQNYGKSGFISLVDVVNYKTDPHSAPAASYLIWKNKELASLCGSDDSVESITCTNPTSTSVYSTGGLQGEDIMMTLTKKNLTTGTTSTLMYGPVYVFNTTSATAPTSYQAVFVYPTFSSFILVGSTSPAFVDSIATTIHYK